MKERKQYTTEFKHGAVRLVTQQGRTHADVAKSLGIYGMQRVTLGTPRQK